MKIIHGSVYTPAFRFEKKNITIRNGRFQGLFEEERESSPGTEGALKSPAEERSNGEEIVDAAGCYVVPGLIDLHFHGCMGADICDGTKEAVRTLARYEASQGVTAICPATLTLPVETLCDILRCGLCTRAA